MNDIKLLLPLLIGGLLGILFWGGLWWTVQRALWSRYVAAWFFCSLMVRTITVLLGFYLTCGENWQRWLAALLGFVIARLFITRLTAHLAGTAPEDSDAS